jgi:hypothetical protein
MMGAYQQPQTTFTNVNFTPQPTTTTTQLNVGSSTFVPKNIKSKATSPKNSTALAQ